MIAIIRLRSAIVVEGKYDEIKLSSFIDGTIIKTNGFSIYNDIEKQNLIKSLSEKSKIVLLTDSDAAGFQIRNFIISILCNENYINVYIPDIYGKEKRKTVHSKERKLGVEGVSKEEILEAFEKAGVFNENHIKNKDEIKKTHLFKDGLYGKNNSAGLRRKFQESLNLPKRLSSNALLSVLNNLFTLEEYNNHLEKFKKAGGE